MIRLQNVFYISYHNPPPKKNPLKQKQKSATDLFTAACIFLFCTFIGMLRTQYKSHKIFYMLYNDYMQFILYAP